MTDADRINEAKAFRRRMAAQYVEDNVVELLSAAKANYSLTSAEADTFRALLGRMRVDNLADFQRRIAATDFSL